MQQKYTIAKLILEQYTTTYNTRLCHKPEDYSLNHHCWENLTPT